MVAHSSGKHFALYPQLLTKDPESRLSSLSDVQSTPYLADMNWDAVFEKALTPSFVPNVSGAPSDGAPPPAGSHPSFRTQPTRSDWPMGRSTLVLLWGQPPPPL